MNKTDIKNSKSLGIVLSPIEEFVFAGYEDVSLN